MVQSISICDAKRYFSGILSRVESGEKIIITRYGKPIAQLMPYKATKFSPGQNQAWDSLISMLEKGLALGGDKFNRDELYDC